MLTLHTLRALVRPRHLQVILRAFRVGVCPLVVCGLAVLLSACGGPAVPQGLSVPVAATSTSVALRSSVSPVETSVASIYAPVISPPDEPASGPTLTAAASMTVIPVPTEIPGLQETMVARATISPFPTAEPPAVQAGSPALATGRQAGLVIELRLDGDSFVAGENVRAQLVARNDSDQTLFVGRVVLSVRDDSGREVSPWPVALGWREGPPPGRSSSMHQELVPGRSISQVVTFQIPEWERSQGRHYVAYASTQFSRPNIQHPDRSDNVPVLIETGRILLQITQPRPEQYLKLEWQADLKGYTLRATDGAGRPISGPAWGAMEVTSERSTTAGPLADSPDGNWSASWEKYQVEGVRSLRVRAWVGARGYVAAAIAGEVDGVAP